MPMTRTIVFFTVTSLLAATIGLILVIIIHPGRFNIYILSLPAP